MPWLAAGFQSLVGNRHSRNGRADNATLSAKAGADDGSSKRRRKADLKRRLTKWLVAGWVKQGSVCAACPGNVRPRDSRIENPPQITVTWLIDCADPGRQSAARRALARQRGSRHQQAREEGVGGVGVRKERAVAQECANPYLPLPATIRSDATSRPPPPLNKDTKQSEITPAVNGASGDAVVCFSCFRSVSEL